MNRGPSKSNFLSLSVSVRLALWGIISALADSTHGQQLLLKTETFDADPGWDGRNNRATDPESTRRAAGILRSGMVEVFPQVASARIDYVWSGNVAFTRDQMPRAGLLDGMYYAGGYCGHGVAMATHLGEEIARRIAGEQVTHPFFDDRFAAIPMYSGTPWFLPLVGAYYQVKDWLQ